MGDLADTPIAGDWPAGDWLQTSSGKALSLDDPRPDQICIADIAEGLSRACRFAGQLRPQTGHYSVAEHCVHLARWFLMCGNCSNARWALLHDATEAYLCDLPAPLKRRLPEYRRIEARLMAVIAGKFGLLDDADSRLARASRAGIIPLCVYDADRRILLDERAQLLAPPPIPWGDQGVEPLDIVVESWSPMAARGEFLRLFDQLFAGRVDAT